MLDCLGDLAMSGSGQTRLVLVKDFACVIHEFAEESGISPGDGVLVDFAHELSS